MVLNSPLSFVSEPVRYSSALCLFLLLFLLIFQEASKVAKDLGLLFTEVSAKTGMAVKDVFETIGQFSIGKHLLYF